jgi:hypothetical protein
MMRWMVLAAAALSLSACVAIPQPIGASVGYANDAALQGMWSGHADKKSAPGFYYVIANDNATMTVVGVSPPDGDDKARWGTLELTTVTLGRNHYLNARETSEDGGPPKPDDMHTANDFVPLYYTIKGDTLSLYSFDEDKVKAAILAKRVQGTITVNKVGLSSYDSVAITADGPHLDAVLKGDDAPALFTPVMTLKRVKASQ